MLVNYKPKDNNRVKFVSYTGQYPCLCMGVLTLEIDGVKHTFGMNQEFPKFWSSGGWITEDYCARQEEWNIDVEDIPEQFRDLAPKIDVIFNENVKHGCCGGCI